MLFSVFTLDNADAAEKRKAVHSAHVAHLKNAKNCGVTITVGGPLVSDDGLSSTGSLMVVEAADRARAEKFNYAIPSERRMGQGRNPALRPQGIVIALRSP